MAVTGNVLSNRVDTVAHPMACAKWVDGGCRIIDTTPEYFSAMAQTKISSDAAEEMRIPWPAFYVRIPPGTLVAADGTDYMTAIVAGFENIPMLDLESRVSRTVPHASFFYLRSETDGPCLWTYMPVPLPDLLFGATLPPPPDHFDEGAMVEDASDARIKELARRAIVGLLFTMQHTNNWKRGGIFSKAGTGRPLRREPPPHRSIIIGRPLSIDVTEAVRADARSGAHAAPSVQTLVRGHIKRQVVGVGRTGRKVVWIEPYWRGPEDAPILARPHLVGA